MEVSSPGLGRPLKKEKTMPEVWEKSWRSEHIGQSIKQKEFYGILTAYDNNSVTIEMEDGSERTFEKKMKSH